MLSSHSCEKSRQADFYHNTHSVKKEFEESRFISPVRRWTHNREEKHRIIILKICTIIEGNARLARASNEPHPFTYLEMLIHEQRPRHKDMGLQRFIGYYKLKMMRVVG